MKILAITLLLVVCIGFVGPAWIRQTSSSKETKPVQSDRTGITVSASPSVSAKILALAQEARTFTSRHDYNSSWCFLIDLAMPSYQKRFFIYDLEKDSILNSGLVTHGNCNEYWLEGRRYNNVVGGGCSSLGKYKIGYAYQGQFGLAFKLHGLDRTNSNAFKRYVVLHAHECVPENETESDICQSNGCPTVSPGFLKILDTMIRRSKKPVLLWITG